MKLSYMYSSIFLLTEGSSNLNQHFDLVQRAALCPPGLIIHRPDYDKKLTTRLLECSDVILIVVDPRELRSTIDTNDKDGSVEPTSVYSLILSLIMSTQSLTAKTLVLVKRISPQHDRLLSILPTNSIVYNSDFDVQRWIAVGTSGSDLRARLLDAAASLARDTQKLKAVSSPVNLSYCRAMFPLGILYFPGSLFAKNPTASNIFGAIQFKSETWYLVFFPDLANDKTEDSKDHPVILEAYLDIEFLAYALAFLQTTIAVIVLTKVLSLSDDSSINLPVPFYCDEFAKRIDFSFLFDLAEIYTSTLSPKSNTDEELETVLPIAVAVSPNSLNGTSRSAGATATVISAPGMHASDMTAKSKYSERSLASYVNYVESAVAGMQSKSLRTNVTFSHMRLNVISPFWREKCGLKQVVVCSSVLWIQGDDAIERWQYFSLLQVIFIFDRTCY